MEQYYNLSEISIPPEEIYYLSKVANFKNEDQQHGGTNFRFRPPKAFAFPWGDGSIGASGNGQGDGQGLGW